MSIPSSQPFRFDQIIGDSPAMNQTIKLAGRVARSDVSCVLLQGESGVGKDCLAKAIHQASPRANNPFVAINCAALPSNLIESELFGYEKGAFTDAKARKEGLFEQADGGTILLDEITELDINLQAKLLRVLEEGTFRRVGGLRDVHFTARVISASNRNLKKETAGGRFRLDLYYRLAVVQIDIAPLRERGDDILLLAEHCLTRLGKRMGRENILALSPEVARAFKHYDWPGNVRELRNVIERAVLLEDGDVISPKCLPSDFFGSLVVKTIGGEVVNGEPADCVFCLPNEGICLDELEASLMNQALTRCNGNQTRAAKLLGLTRDQFRYRWKKVEEANRPRLVAVGGLHR
ncbi:MAG TPA: sigma-54 dependent transcriptional regulator [Pyrinomonadaceae bacterium]|nr:sigma-54 dependent transcriptional regulator [Pyrinomonadaceae bacterium]